jgi:hypothetical protein
MFPPKAIQLFSQGQAKIQTDKETKRHKDTKSERQKDRTTE